MAFFDSVGDFLNSAYSASDRFLQWATCRKDIFRQDIFFDEKAVYFNCPDSWLKKRNYPDHLAWDDIEDMRIVFGNTFKIKPRAGAAGVSMITLAVSPLPFVYQVMGEYRKRRKLHNTGEYLLSIIIQYALIFIPAIAILALCYVLYPLLFH